MLRRWLTTLAVKWLDRHYWNRDKVYQAHVTAARAIQAQADFSCTLSDRLFALEQAFAEAEAENKALRDTVRLAIMGMQRRS